MYGTFPLVRTRCRPELCPTAMATRLGGYSGSQAFLREDQETLDWDSSCYSLRWMQVILGDVRLHKK